MIAGLRFGISVPGAGTATDWVARARRAEAGGFDTLVMPDHLAPAMLSPMVALAMAASVTSTLRLGTLVANHDFRHPVLLAREAATLDLLSDGRFELGLGAGYRRADYDAAGLRFDPASLRLDRMAEAIEVIRGVWSGRPVWFEGAHFETRGTVCEISPAAADIRLLVGANSRRALALAAEAADTVGLVGVGQVEDGTTCTSHFTKSGLDRQVAWVKASASKRPHPPELSILVQHMEICDDRASVVSGLREWFPDLTTDDLLDSPYVLVGSRSYICNQLAEIRDRFGVGYVVILGSSWSHAEEVLNAL